MGLSPNLLGMLCVTSCSIVALASTRPLREVSARYLPGVKERPGLKADKLTVICEPTFYEMSEPRHLIALRPP
jgi:hypothetical protein